ncbi:MAG TPA: SUF system Fe-S cluster assembly protein [Candidatus Limnocylindrales bacterium]|nr:SUF system Fe-S cluster assembly protein [Candidatus Limnocylindrales bacterium]
MPDAVIQQTGQEQPVTLPDSVANASAPVADAGAASEAGGELDIAEMEERIVEALHTVFDPEIPVDIYELGLIYDLRIQPDGHVDIKMTLTTPNCPVAGSMPGMVERVTGMVEGVKSVNVELVWEPMWGPHMMTEAARLQLNMY